MKNDLSNTEIALATTLPESVRISLHSLQADLGYLIGRVIADGSCGPIIIQSMRERLDQIESYFYAPSQQPPMLADIAQIIDAGWKAGKSSAEVAGEILREFDGTAVTSIECGDGK